MESEHEANDVELKEALLINMLLFFNPNRRSRGIDKPLETTTSPFVKLRVME